MSLFTGHQFTPNIFEGIGLPMKLAVSGTFMLRVQSRNTQQNLYILRRFVVETGEIC